MTAEPFVFVRRDAPPPAICFKCGTREALSLVPFHFHVSPGDSAAEEVANAAGMAVSALGDAASLVKLVRLIRETKEATLPVPLCSPCAAKWKAARRARVLAYVPAYATLLAFFVYVFGFKGPGPLVADASLGKYVFIAAFSAVAYLLFVLVPKRVESRIAEPATCAAVAITPQWVALARVHPHAIAELTTLPAPKELLDGLVE